MLALSGLQSSMESTRGHLQKELRTKEADCNRMAVQIRVGLLLLLILSVLLHYENTPMLYTYFS